jgi:hypothetical protein
MSPMHVFPMMMNAVPWNAVMMRKMKKEMRSGDNAVAIEEMKKRMADDSRGLGSC